VELAFSEETAALLGERCKIFVTNQWQHSGLGDAGEKILDTLIGMSNDTVRIPS